MPLNFLYRYARTKFLLGQMNWSTVDKFKVMPLCMTYTSAALASSQATSGYGTVTSQWSLGNTLSNATYGNSVAEGVGFAVSSLAHVPRMHRTYYRAAFAGTMTETDFNAPANKFGSVGIAHSSGGTANTYVINTGATSHTFLGQASIGAGATYGDGVAAGSDLTFYSVGSGTTIGSFIIYQSNGDNDQENTLVAFFDIATSMPVNTNGGDITIVWDTTANRIFKL